MNLLLVGIVVAVVLVAVIRVSRPRPAGWALAATLARVAISHFFWMTYRATAMLVAAKTVTVTEAVTTAPARDPAHRPCRTPWERSALRFEVERLS